MNILALCDFRASHSGNFLNSILALAEAAKKQAHQTVFMFPLRDDGSQCDWVDYLKGFGYPVILFDRNASKEENTRLLMEVLDQYSIDLIHSHFSCLHPILLWDREIHKKVTILFHDHMDYSAEEPYLPQLRKQLKTAKRYKEYGLGVISVMKKKHRGYWCVPDKWYVPNGITFQRNVERSLTREECRQQLGIQENEKLCLFLGWSIYGKGLDVAIKAFLELRKKRTDLVLGVVGFGDTPSQEDLERIQKSVGLNPQQEGIRFLPSFEDMFALHRAADVYLSASRIEAFSYGVLEAISQNVPTVVSDIPGTKWSWKYSKCFHFPNENVARCAEAIEKALPTRDLASNYDQIIQKYNIDDWCQRILRIYEQYQAKK